MLRADSGDNSDSRMDKVAYLLDVARLFGAHLDDKYLVVGFHIFPDRPDDAHCSVIASGSHQSVVFLAKNSV